jgi:hypothetical protein
LKKFNLFIKVRDFQIEVRENEFGGLIGNIAGNLIKDRAGDLIGGLIGGGGGGGGNRGVCYLYYVYCD